MRGRRLAGFAAALLVGAVIGVLLWPSVQREMMLRDLIKDDAIARRAAAQWWGQAARPGASTGDPAPSRLQEHSDYARRAAAGIEGDSPQAVFVDVATLLREEGFWRFPVISEQLWARRLHLILDSQDRAAAESVLDELTAAEAPRNGREIESLWQRVVQWPPHAAVRRRAMMEAAANLPRGRVEELAAAARADEDAGVRRLAWLLLGHLQPESGYAGQWREEQPRVAEAMLWAATATDRDDSATLLTACDASPWPSTTLPWLLARSDDPRARQRLEALVLDGNRPALLHAAERWGDPTERLPAVHQAWLGVLAGDDTEAPMRLRRWAAWRAQPADVADLLDEPVAEDGSAWAAVLLAERLLSRERASDLARQWLSALDPEVQRAGALLYGLTSRDAWRLSEEYEASSNPAFRRAARLGVMMASLGSAAAAADRAYAWTVATTQPGERLDALMALLAVGDTEAAEAVLTAPQGEAGAAMIERAWLIERFLPQYAAMVAPLCPWDDDVAALQFDIMRTAFALESGADRFDTESRTFQPGESRAAP